MSLTRSIDRWECPICGAWDDNAERAKVTCVGPMAERHPATALVKQTFVAVDALLSESALMAAALAHRAARDQIEFFGATEYDGPLPSEAAVRAAVESLGVTSTGTGGAT